MKKNKYWKIMDLYEKHAAEPSNPFNILRKCGLLASDLIPYGTFRLTLRKYEMIAFKVNSVSSSTKSIRNFSE